jgi:hypothetical protein
MESTSGGPASRQAMWRIVAGRFIRVSSSGVVRRSAAGWIRHWRPL